jgi:hypothetical protein
LVGYGPKRSALANQKRLSTTTFLSSENEGAFYLYEYPA